MRVEQALTLLNLKDDCYHIEDQTIIKRGNTLSFVNSNDNVAFAKVLNPYIKTAEGVLTLTVAMPSAKSYDYSRYELEKIAANQIDDDNLNKRVQVALLKLSEEERPMPTIQGIKTLASIMTNGYSPDIINLKFAQWGGHGNMVDNQAGRGSSMYGFSKGTDPNGFDRWQAQISLDSMLDLGHRGDPRMGFLPIEAKLETCGFFNHKYADENAEKYNMTWTERIISKNKARLLRMLKEKEERDKREREREPRKIRLDTDNYSPRHYSGIEYWLDEKRSADPEDYIPKKGRLEEWTPEWYSQLSTLRKNASVISKNVGLKSLAYYMNVHTEDSTDPSRRPSRRDMNDDPYNLDENPIFRSQNQVMASEDSIPDPIGSLGSGHDQSAELDVHKKSDQSAEETEAQVALTGTTILPDAYQDYERMMSHMPLPHVNNLPMAEMPKKEDQWEDTEETPIEKKLDVFKRKKPKRTPTDHRSISDFGVDGTPNAFNQVPGVPGESGRHMAL